MYGLLDEFAQYVNTGKGFTAAMGSSGQWGSRFGVKGTEDIGGGNRVNFVLENGFNPTDGSLAQSNTLFSRQAWVGLGGSWGQVRVGQQNSPLFNDQGGQDAFGGGTQASGMNNLSTFAARTSNTVSYLLPEFAGLQGGIYVGLGNAGGLGSAGSSYQFDLTYARGPLAAFVAGQWLKNATNTTTDRAVFAGASYAIGKATLYGSYAASRWDDLDVNDDVYGLSAKYQLTPAGSVALGYAILRDNTSQHDDANQASLMCEYDLSRRTDLYATLSFLQNHSQAGYTLAGSANPGLPLAYPGADARGVEVGVVQRF
ncbi:Outer membrane porin protein 32 [Pararobbsia alpina]|uniref:Outer membrane porin protein 32 n=2 Tax=Pararobbsia alpina TaxID=621374 RepID=A0A6S7BP44_9BURK|nr:Outer membrane porin protein 32 [Pararobbsia alpina]